METKFQVGIFFLEMLDLGIIRFLVCLCIPWIVGRIVQRIRGENVATTEKKVHVRGSRLVHLIVMGAMLHMLYYVMWGAPRNIFEKVDIPNNALGFQFRAKYNEYMETRRNNSQVFNLAYETYKKSGIDNNVEYPRLRMQAKTHVFGWCYGEDGRYVSNQELEVRCLEYLFEKLKSPSRREVYLKYGEEALIDGTFCTDDMDYMLFVGPGVLLSYVYFLGLVGVLTILPQKQWWRNVGIFLGGMILVGEALYYISPNEMRSIDVYSIFWKTEMVGTFQKLDITRNICFLCLLGIMMLIDYGQKRSDKAVVRDILRAQEAVLGRSETIRLMRSAVLENSVLRKFYLEHHEQMEIEWNSEAMAKKKNAILRKYDVSEMVRVAREHVGDLVMDAERIVHRSKGEHED